MDRAVAFLFLRDEPEEGACFRAIQKGALLTILIQKEGGFIGIDRDSCPLAGITVQYNIAEIAEIGFYDMDKTEMAATVAALAAFKYQADSPGTSFGILSKYP
ncbi:MAG: hypothetical protein XE11_2448 [Methanomicrobiales archaeon 53_19]|nr:MAG: hypothetical protein XE11_2448 [Methanomicrobiales archaeon 53_19]